MEKLTDEDRTVLEHVAIAIELADMMLAPIVPERPESEIEMEADEPEGQSGSLRGAIHLLGLAKLMVGRALTGVDLFPSEWLADLFEALEPFHKSEADAIDRARAIKAGASETEAS